MATPSIVVTGKAGSFARRAPVPSGGILDMWTWTPAGHHGDDDARPGRCTMLVVSIGEMGHFLWVLSGTGGVDVLSMPTVFNSRLHTDEARAREVCRHLARQCAKGEIPMPPTGPVDQRVWHAAVAINDGFVERWGILAEVK